MIKANIVKKINSLKIISIIHRKTCKLSTNRTHQGSTLKIKIFISTNLSHPNQSNMIKFRISKISSLPVTTTG